MYSPKIQELIAAQKPQNILLDLSAIVKIAEQNGWEVVSGDSSPVRLFDKKNAAIIIWGQVRSELKMVKEKRGFGPLKYNVSSWHSIVTREHWYVQFEPFAGFELKWYAYLKEGRIFFSPSLWGREYSHGKRELEREFEPKLFASATLAEEIVLDTGGDPIVELPVPVWVQGYCGGCGYGEVDYLTCLQSEVAEIIGDFRQQLDELLK